MPSGLGSQAIQALKGQLCNKSNHVVMLTHASALCTCSRDGKYSLMFEEWVSEGPFIISPRIAFEVSGKHT